MLIQTVMLLKVCKRDKRGMENLQVLIIAYLITVNIIGFIMTGVDKYRAVQRKWRIAERTLFAFALLGGGMGVYTGCIIFNHKTRTLKFMIGIPVICIIEAIIILYFI